jgi:ATP-dependent protease ClpP protease subunit
MPSKIQVRAAGARRAEVLIQEAIGENWYGDGLTAKRFGRELAALGEVDEILVRINSPGGAVFDGVAIYNTLKAHGATIEVFVEGLAASIASVIAMAGDKIRMGHGAMLMIHNPWTVAIGDADDMRDVADMLDKVGESLVDIYHERTGIEASEIKKLLTAETWLTATDAVEQGFADEVDSAAKDETPTPEDALRARVATLKNEFRQSAEKSQLRIAAALIKSAGADALRNQENAMPEKVASAEDADKLKNEGAQAALAADKTRRAGIRAAFGKFAVAHAVLLNACLDDTECSIDAAKGKLLDKLGEGAEGLAGAPRVEAGQDARDKFIAGAEQAILVRAGLAKPEGANEFRGMGVAELAVAALRHANISVTGLTRAQVASRIFATHTTSDFPNLLSNVAGKVLRKAYGEFPPVWKECFAKGSVSDFKVHPRIQIGQFAGLATIVEGGEYTYGSTKEEYENASALTKGKAIQFTRQMLINDDLGGFLNRAARMGRAAARSVNSDAFAYLISGSSGHGPTCADGGQMFNATVASATTSGHANLLSSGTAISVDSIGARRTAMRLQKDKAMNQTLNIEPKVLLCSVLKEDLANSVVKSRTKDGQSNPEQINVHQNRLKVVSDPVIDTLNSGLSWYLLADPLEVPILEVVFLDGVEEPFIDERIEFSTDALDLKVRLDYGIANGDWRGGQKNVGA